ncbi:MAG: universal stress protein [Hymenobacteraceae bacterium]|nr:universal stress protein [Hymenobacteraceae bacterium]
MAAALVVTGLTATDEQLDEWLSNRTLPLARQMGYPLLVPAHLPDTAIQPPRRLALAVEDRAFRLAPNATAVAPLLDALGTEIVTVVVLPSDNWTGGHTGLSVARACGLAASMPHSPLHKVGGEQPAPGILHAVDALAADVLAVLDRGHDWVDRLFIDSTTDQILRQKQTPVLLLAAHDALAAE